MEIFLDSANIDALVKFKPLISGVTTNPAIMAKDKATQESRLLELANLAPNLPISGEVVYTNSVEQVCADARKIAAIAPNIVVKIPGNFIGLSCIKILKAEGIKLNITALLTFNQLALAAELGADYVSQFYCRGKEAGVNSAREINMTREYIEQNKLSTKIIVGSFRTAQDVETVLLTRGHIATINPEIMELAFSHPKTQNFVDEFAKKYEESIKK